MFRFLLFYFFFNSFLTIASPSKPFRIEFKSSDQTTENDVLAHEQNKIEKKKKK